MGPWCTRKRPLTTRGTDWMEEEFTTDLILLCNLQMAIHSVRNLSEKKKETCHLNFAKIQQHLQADQLLDLFHFSDPLVTLAHYLVRADKRHRF